MELFAINLQGITNSVELVLDDSGDKIGRSTETFHLDTEELPMTTPTGDNKDAPTALQKFLAKHKRNISITIRVIIHGLIIVYFAFATKYYITYTDSKRWEK